MTPNCLACNYLIEAEELLLEGSVSFDYFKFPSFGLEPGEKGLADFFALLEKIIKVKPVLYHGIYPNTTNLCAPHFKEDFDITVLKQVCELAGSPGISIHLDGADKQMSRKNVVATAIDAISYLKEHFSNMTFISLENTEHSLNPHIFDPLVISEIIHETGLAFLLDVSHANWAAEERGDSLLDYIGQLPMDQLYEIHINGWIKHQGEQIAHLKIQDELYPLIESLIAHSPAQIITLEYGRSLAVPGADLPLVSSQKSNPRAKAELKEQLLRLSELI